MMHLEHYLLLCLISGRMKFPQLRVSDVKNCENTEAYISDLHFLLRSLTLQQNLHIYKDFQTSRNRLAHSQTLFNSSANSTRSPVADDI